MILVRLLYFCATHYNINVMITHITSTNNSIADAISHFQMNRFRSLGPTANPHTGPLPCLADPILSQLREHCQYLGIAPST